MKRQATRFTAAAISLGYLCLTSCAPWTVRPIDAEKPTTSGPATANPVEYVDSIWSARLVPAVLAGAVEARVLLDALAQSPEEAAARFGHREANGPAYLLVKGQGTVTAVDTHSRVGLALVDIAPYDGRPEISIQIGPVLRGTALRDSTGIVRFTDFVNQLQFADVGNEINGRVLKTVLAPLDRAMLKGRVVSFAGAVSAPESKGEPPLRELVPVQLTIEERP